MQNGLVVHLACDCRDDALVYFGVNFWVISSRLVIIIGMDYWDRLTSVSTTVLVYTWSPIHQIDTLPG